MRRASPAPRAPGREARGSTTASAWTKRLYKTNSAYKAISPYKTNSLYRSNAAPGWVSLCLALALAACSHSGAPPSLGDSLSVEQAGGNATELIATGTQLPTSATESFTTSRDGETKLYVHVLRGAARKAGNLASDGWWSIDGLAPGPAGQAQVFVTFELDAKADLSLSARQEAVKLKVAKLLQPPESGKPAPLTEPDDDDDAPDDGE